MRRIELEEALEAMEPQTKASRVREVMPVIERKLAAGVRLGAILDVLNKAGLELSLATLRTYLYESRRKTLGTPAGVADTQAPSQPRPREPQRLSATPSRATGTRLASDLAQDGPLEQEDQDHSDSGAVAGESLSMRDFARLLKPDPVESNEQARQYAMITRERHGRRFQRHQPP